jgi:hypothetical protein
VIREHVLSCRTQAKLLLKLKRAHRSKGTKMVMQRRPAHACDPLERLSAKRLRAQHRSLRRKNCATP